MRLLLLATAIAVASICALPLLIVMVPSAVFRAYIRYIPIEFSHPHVQDSVASIVDIRTAVLCFLPSHMTMGIFCADGGEALENALPLELLLLNQQTTFEASARYGPNPHAMASLSLLAQTTRPGLVLDGMASLLDGEPVVRGIGETRVLEEITSRSMATAEAFYRFLVQFELAVCRAAFMQNTVSVALSLLEQLDLSDRLLREGLPLPVLDRVASILSLSMRNSLKHIREELRTCISASVALLSAIERAQMDESRLRRRCAYPASAACAQALALVRNEGMIRLAIDDMTTLMEVFDTEIDGVAPSHGGHSSLLILVPTVQVHEAALHGLLMYAQSAREAAAATLKAGRV